MASARKVANREAIVDSALRLFSERGYDAVRIEDVTHAAGVSRATFYNHFSGREEIVAALFERLLGDDTAGPDGAGGRRSALQEVSRVATDAARRMLGQPDLARFLYSLPVRQESFVKPEEPSTPGVFTRIHRLLEAAAERGELRGDVPLDLMCVHVHNALEAGMRAWARGDTDDPAERVGTLVELAIHGVVAR